MLRASRTCRFVREALIPLQRPQKIILGLGSAVAAVRDPWRADMVAVAGETLFPEKSLQRLANNMNFHPVGRRILREKPLLSNKVVSDWLETAKDSEKFRDNFEALEKTFGYQLLKFLTEKNISLDTRRPVKFATSEELAYVLTRYRQVHDILHLLLDQKTNFRGESNIKVFEAVHSKGLPMTVFGGTVAPAVKLKGQNRHEFFTEDFGRSFSSALGSCNIYNVYYEERFGQSLEDLRRELNLNL